MAARFLDEKLGRQSLYLLRPGKEQFGIKRSGVWVQVSEIDTPFGYPAGVTEQELDMIPEIRERFTLRTGIRACQEKYHPESQEPD